MNVTHAASTVLTTLALTSCAVDDAAPPEVTTTAQALSAVCEDDDILVGIDVSKWQGAVDWAAVKGDGVTFAFARVSDGTSNVDNTFADNWAGMKAAGLVRGAYQFFRPNQDVEAQAALMIDMLGELEPTDLPPVIDVEADGGLSPSSVDAAVGEWIALVQAATGRRPIIYTGPYFWRDMVGEADHLPSPLWVAHYGADCPLTPEPWATWSFWQFTDSGDIAGVDTPVDTNLFNGNLAELMAMTGGEATCGDDICSAGEDTATCAADCPPCGVIAADGGLVDDGDACFTAGGPQQYIRLAADAGQGGDLRWTNVTANEEEANYADWDLFFAEGGRYEVEVYTDAAYARTTAARYQVAYGDAIAEVVIDQTSNDGWQSLGEFVFVAGGDQSVHVGDNTGESGAEDIAMVLDAVRLTRLDGGGDDDDPTDEGGDDDDANSDTSAGCSAGGAAGGSATLVWVMSALGAVTWRRRRARR